MKAIVTLLCVFLGSTISWAQVITFDDQGSVDGQALGNPYMIANNGETFVFTVSGVTGGPTTHRYRTTDSFGCGNTGLSHLSSGTFPATTWTIETQSGNEVDFGTIQFDNFFQCYVFAYELTIEGFKNNVSTGSQTFSVEGMNSIFTPNAAFDDVDKIVITCADLGNLGIDNINWSSSTLHNQSYLLYDSVQLRYSKNSNTIEINTLNSGAHLYKYTMYDISGNQVKEGNESKIETFQLSKGIYFVKLDFNIGTVLKKLTF